MIDVIVDSHEKGDTREYFVSSFINDGIIPKVEALPAGDFLIYGKTEKDAILIERKEASDFISSLKEGRLWDQMAKMKESGIEDRRVIIEGDPLKARSLWYGKKLTPNNIYGAYDGIFKWGVKIVWVSDIYQTSAYIRNLINKQKKPKKVFALRSSPQRTLSLQEKKEYLLEGLPEVGAKTAKEILKKYKTITNFVNNVDTVDTISGIGEKTKKEIKEVLV